MWPILACLCPHRPILPNLQRLEVSFFIYDRNEYLIPLLSPSLKTLVIDCVCPPKHNAIPTFLNLAKVRGCHLEDFTYLEHPTYKVFEAIALFKTLQHVRLPVGDTPELKVSITIAQFLASIPSLRSLKCHVEAFAPSASHEDQLCHTSLQKIKIKSNQKTLREFSVCARSLLSPT